MDPRYLSTGQAAKVCSVTPDTILKWIRAGRLPARRTAGGHHRVDARDLERVVQVASSDSPLKKLRAEPGHFRYCWEHKGQGGLLPGCKECAVYNLRAQRCYELVKMAPEVGHSQVFCQGSCEQCDYYQLVQGQATNVLVVTSDPELTSSLQRDAGEAEMNLQFVDCEYTCSAIVEAFRPDFAVIDCDIGTEFAGDITQHLSQDPRIPFVRVILAGEGDEFPEACDHLVFARIERPFSLLDLAECTDEPWKRAAG